MHQYVHTTKGNPLPMLYNTELPTDDVSGGASYADCLGVGRGPPKEPPQVFLCAHCMRPVHPLRYAPHLEKCMGVGGRRSSANTTL